MIRKIVDYQKLNDDILNLLVKKFPDGYYDKDIIAFRNAKNEYIEAVEVKTEDTIFLIKVGKRLDQAMEDFEENSNDYDSVDDENDDTIDLCGLNENDLVD